MVISEDIPPFQYEAKKKCLSILTYSTWPIFMLSFIRLFSISIFDRAFLNYVYFYRSITESTLGLISSATPIAYIFGPILGHLITSRLGIKHSIMISTFTTPLLMGAQMIYFAPWYLISMRVFSGLSLGVYWPNCYNLLSRWQSVSNSEKAKSNFKNFNYSWNLGFILGLLSGYLFAFSLNEYYAMTIGWAISLLLLPFSFSLKKESELNHLVENQSLDNPPNQPNNMNSNSNHQMIVYPILFSWLAILTYTMTKAIVRLSYPVLLKEFGDPSYFTYINQLVIQLGQLSGLTLINYMNTYTRKLTTLASTIAIIFISLTIVLFHNMLFISIISASVGIFVGLIQGISLKIMIDYGAAQNVKKYSTINEIIKGIGFGLTSIAAGFIAEINIYANFAFLLIFGIFVLVSLSYLSRNVISHNTFNKFKNLTT